MHKFLKAVGLTGALALAVATGAMASDGGTSGDSKLFVKNAVEHADDTVTLPLRRGTSHGRTVYYVVLDTSNGNLSQSLGSNTSQKLANARGTSAVQKVRVSSGGVDFPATVDFSPTHLIAGTPGTGFPPTIAQPGAVGEAGYSPLIELPDGTVENAPQLARDADGDGRIDLFTEAADKVVAIDPAAGTVTYRETNGFQGGKALKYVSTDSSSPVAAALEDVTFAPALDAAPSVGDDSTASARATLIGFVNGQTGVANPQRQGLNSALLGEGDPLNLLRWNPSQGRYSPLWDVNLARWSDAAVAGGQNVRQTDVGDAQNLAAHGILTAPDGTSLRASGFIVNCPIVSQVS